MDDKIKVYLPLHVATYDLFVVILKSMGNHCYRQERGKRADSVDITKPSASFNNWDLVFMHPRETNPKTISDEYHVIEFNDFSKLPMPYSFDYYQHGIVNDEELKNNKLFVAQPSALSCVLSKKIVDFFGGRIVYPKNYNQEQYVCNNPMHPYSDNKREMYFQLQNALHDLPKITKEEIVQVRQSGIKEAIDILFLHRLDNNFINSFLASEELNEELSTQVENKKNKKAKL